MVTVNTKAQKSRKGNEFVIPPLLKATRNTVLTDLDKLSLKTGDVVNLYALFGAGRVKKSLTAKYAVQNKILIPVDDSKPAQSADSAAPAKKTNKTL